MMRPLHPCLPGWLGEDEGGCPPPGSPASAAPVCGEVLDGHRTVSPRLPHTTTTGAHAQPDPSRRWYVGADSISGGMPPCSSYLTIPCRPPCTAREGGWSHVPPMAVTRGHTTDPSQLFQAVMPVDHESAEHEWGLSIRACSSRAVALHTRLPHSLTCVPFARSTPKSSSMCSAVCQQHTPYSNTWPSALTASSRVVLRLWRGDPRANLWLFGPSCLSRCSRPLTQHRY